MNVMIPSVGNATKNHVSACFEDYNMQLIADQLLCGRTHECQNWPRSATRLGQWGSWLELNQMLFDSIYGCDVFYVHISVLILYTPKHTASEPYEQKFLKSAHALCWVPHAQESNPFIQTFLKPFNVIMKPSEMSECMYCFVLNVRLSLSSLKSILYTRNHSYAISYKGIFAITE